MQQRPDVDKAMLFASAAVITYFRDAERVQLRKNASVEQDGAVVRGDLIVYLIPEQRVRADASADDADSRVQVLIPARVAGGEQAAGPGRGAAADNAGDGPAAATPGRDPQQTEAPAAGEARPQAAEAQD
jgi:hypothetical protein